MLFVPETSVMVHSSEADRAAAMTLQVPRQRHAQDSTKRCVINLVLRMPQAADVQPAE